MEPWHNPLDWAEETRHPEGQLGGYVIDEGVARSSPCKCISLSSGSELCFSKGIVGALDSNQRVIYCPSVETVKASPEQEARIDRFKRAAATCHEETKDITDPEQKFGARLGCMKRELSRTGASTYTSGYYAVVNEGAAGYSVRLVEPPEGKTYGPAVATYPHTSEGYNSAMDKSLELNKGLVK